MTNTYFFKKQSMPSADKNAEQLKLSCIAGWSINWQNHFGKLYGGTY